MTEAGLYRLLVGAGLLALPLTSRAQTSPPLSLDSAVTGALRASPLVRQATEGVREQAALRRVFDRLTQSVRPAARN